MFKQFPGCFWILAILLLILGPQGFGKMFIGGMFFGLAFLVLAWSALNFLIGSLNVNQYLREQTEEHNMFGSYLIHFMTRVAAAHGSIEPAEVNLIRSFFRTHLRYGPSQMLWVDRLIRASAKSEETVEGLCAGFSSRFGLHETAILIQLLYQVAMADGRIQESEQTLIERIVSLLHFPEAQHQAIRRMLFRDLEQAGGSAYQVLGLQEDALPAEIKKRYRDLSKEHHPDRVAHLGPEFQEVAEEKMVRINQAYEQLKKMGKV